METKHLKAGERIMIPTWSSSELCSVLSVAEYEDEHLTGRIVTVQLDDGRIYDEFITDSEDYSAEYTRRSGMPYHKRLDAFDWGYYGRDMTTTQRMVDAFVNRYDDFSSRGYGLYICSEVNGSGKTFLACCMAMELIKRNIPVQFVTLNDYVGMLSAKDQAAADIRDAQCLIVDDIGAQGEKQEWISDAIYRLVDYRYRENLVTIYTSNMPLKKSSKNDRVVSRISETSHDVRLPEVSVRELLAAKKKQEFLRGLVA